uniref:Uncharacterized protein n=1 Tax=Meloidogyne javanica TaxID=6303 RepID=A0A915M950_MELJA
MKIKFFVLLFMAIIISLNIVAINCRYVSVDASFEERPFKSRKVNYRHDYSEEYEEHIYYEDEEPEKPEPKPEEPKPEEPKPESTEKWTLAPQAIFNKIPKQSKTIKDWLDTKTVNKWEDQPEVSSAFEKIRGEMEKVYSVSNWEKPIEDGKDKGKVKQKQLWHKALFLIDALFQLYAKVLSELTNLVDKNNEQVINEVCADKVKDLDKEKKCSKGLEALVKMNKENIEKIDDFYKLHDNFGKEDKVTDAAETIYAFPKLFRDWLREKTHDWKEQPEATKAFNYIKEEITKIYSLKEDITRLNEFKNLFEKWDDFSKNIKGNFEVELDAGDAPAPPLEARKVRKVVNIRERGEVEYFHPKGFDYSHELEFHPGYHFPRRHLRHRGPYEIKGKYHIKSRSNKV